MNIATVISARVNSSRLPGKVLYELGGVTMIEFLINRLKKSRLCNQFFLATSINPENGALAEIAKKNTTSEIGAHASEDAATHGRHTLGNPAATFGTAEHERDPAVQQTRANAGRAGAAQQRRQCDARIPEDGGSGGFAYRKRASTV